MRVLEPPEARRILIQYPDLRISDIPDNGLILDRRYFLTVNSEGEVTVFSLDPNDE